jgi:hypothetical protein
MSQSQLRTLLTVIIWIVVAAGFGATVLANGGPATYADDSPRRVVGGIFLAAGLLGTPLMRLLTRKMTGAGAIGSDERDEEIAAKATRAGLVVVVALVFAGTIALWEVYQVPGSVPVGWMWVIAYSTWTLSYLVPAAISLGLYLGTMRNAEG